MFVVVLNVLGTFKSYPDVTNCIGVFKDDSQLSYNEYAQLLDSLNEARLANDLNDIEFIKQVNIAIQKRFLHWDFKEYDDYYGQKIGPKDNWILWIITQIRNDDNYFYHSPKDAAKRGLGQCGQQSHALMGVLNNYGYKAYTIGLGGHVITGVELNGSEVLLDPDYGVFLSKSLNEIEKDDILKYYDGIDNVYTDTSNYFIGVNDMIKLYMSKDDNWRSTERTVTVGWKYIMVEKFSVIGKWLIPSLLLLFGGINMKKKY